MAMSSAQILSDITVFNKYARYREVFGRREMFDEIADRNEEMHLKKFKDNPAICVEIKRVYRDFVKTKKILPSMRSLQFGGKPIEVSPNRIYNCCFLPIDDFRAFSESMFLLLGGTGVGYSVQKKHVSKLPPVRKPLKKRRFLVADSIEGWADAIKALMRAYMEGLSLPDFDFRDIREKGAPLITSGGQAPGPQPLKDCLHNIKKILDAKEDGAYLTTLEAHDIMCFIADAVLAGGIRRAACISLFDMDDEDMLTCKFGNWWELNPQRGRANNSAVIVRHKIKKKDFFSLWERIKASGSGEPGFYFTNNADWGTNPCCEIALRPFQFCNLCEINMGNITSQQDLNERARAAAFIGTLQASVSGTGIASGAFKRFSLKEASLEVIRENIKVANQIGINHAARTTCVKPAGTSSMVLGQSSGIHGWHSKYYIRRMRSGKNEALYLFLKKHHPELVEDDFMKPQSDAVISIPIEAPKGAILRTESPLELLERVKHFHNDWVKPGHIKGENTHNVSATISIKDHEWGAVGKWMWDNKEFYNGLSVLPWDGGTYVQAPFEEISSQKYHAMLKHLQDVDLTKVKEDGDYTDLSGEIACAGGVCEIQF
jgi:ribonucleoside-diphosphate reductase alpha chain